MKTESRKESSIAQVVDTNEAPKQKMSPATRRALALTLAGTAAFGLVGCATGENTPGSDGGPLEPEYKVGQVELPAEMIEDRNDVLEMCNTGEGAGEMKQVWNDYFKAKYNDVEFIDAVKNSTDFVYIDDQAVINYGQHTYKTINLLAENCEEVIWLATRDPLVSGLPESASKSLEEYRSSAIPDLYKDSMQSMANNLTAITEAAQS